MKHAVVLMMMLGLLGGSFMLAPTASAAGGAGITLEGPVLAQGTPLDGKIDEITTMLTGLGRPLAILAAVLVALTYIAEPALPDMARENKGMMRKVLFSAMLLGVIPDIINFFMGA